MKTHWSIQRETRPLVCLNWGEHSDKRDEFHMARALSLASGDVPLELLSSAIYAGISAYAVHTVRQAVGGSCQGKVMPYLLRLGCVSQYYPTFGRFGPSFNCAVVIPAAGRRLDRNG